MSCTLLYSVQYMYSSKQCVCVCVGGGGGDKLGNPFVGQLWLADYLWECNGIVFQFHYSAPVECKNWDQ